MRPSKFKKIKIYFGNDKKKVAKALGITVRHVYNIEKKGVRSKSLQKLIDCLYDRLVHPKEDP